MFLRRRLHLYLAWSTLIFGLLAVASVFIDIPGTSSGAPGSTASTTTVPRTTTSFIPREYTVQPGDNLYNIAERFDLSAPALVELNNITNPDRVPVGTVLKLPPSAGFVPIGATTTMPP